MKRLTHAELGDLYRRYGHLVLRRCRSILGSDAEAQDILQEVFVRALRYQHSLDAADSKLAWMYRCAERCCFDRLHKNRREVSVLTDSLVELAVERRPYAAAEARQVLTVFFAKLEPKMQQLAVMHYVDELTQEEISQHIGWSRKTVGRKLRLLQQRGQCLAGTLPRTEVMP